ncbi:MAG: penicillin-binding protein activator LpoB [Deltaproteobacteria bacterium]|nr:penicillin-binding protein activator LpoB [Deltaproteobacteria bacterium]
MKKSTTLRLGSILSRRLGLAAVVAMTAVACTPSFQGEYADPAKAEIVDDKWNETDARKTAEHMIKGMLEKPWLEGYKSGHRNAKPVVVVMDVENRTDEHLDVKQLTDYIQDELINSGKVRFVNKESRQKILDELKYQQSGAVNKATAKKEGRAIGADFILSGNISSSVHQMDGLKTVNYQTNLTLTSIETQEIEWSTKYEVKKRFKRSGASW